MSKRVLNILVLCGGSGSGKTFIRDLLVEGNPEGLYLSKPIVSFHRPMQVTTRKMRLGESPDNYCFVDTDTFHLFNNNNLLTAKTFFDGCEYGTLKSNLIYGQNVVNIIVASSLGKKNLIEDFQCQENVNIKTALVLGNPDDGLINEHGRDISFFKDELFDLLQEKYDYYIPNYGPDDYCDYKTVLRYLGYLK